MSKSLAGTVKVRCLENGHFLVEFSHTEDQIGRIAYEGGHADLAVAVDDGLKRLRAHLLTLTPETPVVRDVIVEYPAMTF